MHITHKSRRITFSLELLVLFLGLVLLNVHPAYSTATVQAGIFASPPDLTVNAKATGGNLTTTLSTEFGVIVTLRYSSSYTVALSVPTSAFGLTLDNSFTSGGYIYNVYSCATSTTSSFNDGVEVNLMTITVSGGNGTEMFELVQDAATSAHNGDWYFDYAGVEYENTSDPFYTTSAALPIQLASFTATVVRNNDVEVAWKTVSETNNYGFEVYRKRNENGVWKKLGFIEGHGTTLAAQSYTYLDSSLGFGKYYYQIKQIDLDGKSKTFPEMDVVVGVAPDQFVLAQNYPNPFNPTTTIEFALPKETHVSLEVYNVIGQRVATLVDEARPTGIYVVPFNASALASGTYFYRLTTKEVTFIKRMMILK
jgi:hypothetical protein